MDTLKPGRTIRCTVTRMPRTEDSVQTVARLMRQDRTIAKGLRMAQRRRKLNRFIYIRGGRRWHKREKCAAIARVHDGATWSMTYTPLLEKDLQAVAQYLSVETQ